MNESRICNLLEQAISKFGICLNRYSVLTEAASGYFAITPLLAAMGGAKRVFAMTRDSRYGSIDEIKNNTLRLADRLGVRDQIEFIVSRLDQRIGHADIVTNLGFVRPINEDLIRKLKRTAVIPLMWETWEFRAQDLDLGLCHSLGIPILGTNEHHHDLRIFGYIGHVVSKLLYELELEIFKSNVVILGSGEFAAEANKMLAAAGANVTVIEPTKLKSAQGTEHIEQADALVVLEHHDRQQLIGRDGLISARELLELNPAIVIAHVCGGVDQGDLESAGLCFYPAAIAAPGYMSVSTTYVGPKPVVELHAAGLRVGQAMADAVSTGLGGIEVERWVLENCEYAQGFRNRH